MLHACGKEVLGYLVVFVVVDIGFSPIDLELLPGEGREPDYCVLFRFYLFTYLPYPIVEVTGAAFVWVVLVLPTLLTHPFHRNILSDPALNVFFVELVHF